MASSDAESRRVGAAGLSGGIPAENDGHTLVTSREGLSYCTTCGGAEGSIPTECPGLRMHSKLEERVYAGVLDFVGGRWVQHQVAGLVIRMPERYFHVPGIHQGRQDHELSTHPCPLSAVHRWGHGVELDELLGVVTDDSW